MYYRNLVFLPQSPWINNKYLENPYHNLVNCHSILIKKINLLNIAEMYSLN